MAARVSDLDGRGECVKSHVPALALHLNLSLTLRMPNARALTARLLSVVPNEDLSGREDPAQQENTLGGQENYRDIFARIFLAFSHVHERL